MKLLIILLIIILFLFLFLFLSYEKSEAFNHPNVVDTDGRYRPYNFYPQMSVLRNDIRLSDAAHDRTPAYPWNYTQNMVRSNPSYNDHLRYEVMNA